MKTTKKRPPKPQRASRTSPSAGSDFHVVCTATNPHQWITLYENGIVRLHAGDVANANPCGLPYRTHTFKTTAKERMFAMTIIHKLNLLAIGNLGAPCEVCRVV
jgi:hypothetical protein